MTANAPGKMACIAPVVSAALMAAATMGIAVAAPLDDVKTTEIAKGELTMEWKMGVSRWPTRAPAPGNEGAASLGIGYAPTDFWMMEIHLNADRPPDTAARIGALEWENKFLLLENRAAGHAVGILTAIELPRERSEGIALLAGPLWQARVGASQTNLNVLLARRVRSRQAEVGETVLQYQAQWLQPLGAGRAFAVQAMGEVGQWNRWRSRPAQQHNLGIAYFGTLGDGKEQGVRFELGGLLGATRASPRHTVRLKIEFDL